MALATLALLTLLAPAQQQAPVLTDEQAIEGFVDAAKDKKALPDLLILGIEDLAKRFAASADRAAVAAEKLELDEGKASDWKKILKTEEDLQEELAEAVWATFRYRKKVTEQEMDIWRAAVNAFAGMGSFGAEHLWEVFEDKRFSREGPFLSRVAEAVGRTKDYEQYEELIDLLDYHLEDVVVGVARGFQHYDKAPGKVRQACAEKLVRALESYRSIGDGAENIDGPRVWGKVKGPLIGALRAVTGHSYDTSLDWVKFWNEFKDDRDLWKDPED